MNRNYSKGRQYSGGPQQSNVQVMFDPAKTDTELYDKLAEDQEAALSSKVNSSQLRRYFGELKGLYNQFRVLKGGQLDSEELQRVYGEKIEPRFKMLRSKLAYGRRPGARGALQQDFAHVLEEGIGKVQDAQQFERFVLHIEAVVGFMYGNGKVSK